MQNAGIGLEAVAKLTLSFGYRVMSCSDCRPVRDFPVITPSPCGAFGLHLNWYYVFLSDLALILIRCLDSGTSVGGVVGSILL